MEQAYRAAVSSVGAATLDVLTALEQAVRHLDPPLLPRVRELLAPRADALHNALDAFLDERPPDGLEELGKQLGEAAGFASRAIRQFVEPPAEAGIAAILESMRLNCRALESLYPLRRALPPVARFFSEPALHDSVEQLDPEPPAGVKTGILHAPGPGREGERGGFWLYVPERYDGSADWPLVVALHGGSGQGRDFLWTWLREARSRRVLLAAPSSLGPTWSFLGEDVDAARLRALVDRVAEGWRVDPERVLLTGLSDGATYTLFSGLQEDAPWTALAPLSGVLHPTLLADGSLDRARGRRIWLVHGARDWMFPVVVARLARDALLKAGAELSYQELPDLSHTYAREQNGLILEWFDPTLAAD